MSASKPELLCVRTQHIRHPNILQKYNCLCCGNCTIGSMSTIGIALGLRIPPDVKLEAVWKPLVTVTATVRVRSASIQLRSASIREDPLQ